MKINARVCFNESYIHVQPDKRTDSTSYSGAIATYNAEATDIIYITHFKY